MCVWVLIGLPWVVGVRKPSDSPAQAIASVLIEGFDRHYGSF